MKAIKTCLLLMICLLTFGMIGLKNVQAESNVTKDTYTYVNPAYKNIIDPDDYPAPEESETSDDVMLEAASSPDYFQTVEKAGAYVRSCMLNRQSKITFCLRSANNNFNELIEDIIDVALAHTGMSTEGDYIRYQFGLVNVPYSYWPSGNYYYCNYSFIPVYYTTAAEEKELNSLVKAAETAAFQNLSSSDATDYEKLYYLYSYICKNVSYDKSHEDNTSYLHQFTAYAALKDKTAVCQGYANLFYRMALDSGIDCRIIGGTISNNPEDGHAWNIVQLYGKYYNMDTTWGSDGYHSNGYLVANYFMKGSTRYCLSASSASTQTYAYDQDHIRDSEYCIQSFLKSYPMSQTDFSSQTEKQTGHSHTTANGIKQATVSATCTEGGYTLYKCKSCGQTFRANETQALGHSYATETLVRATPSKNGHEAGKYCTRCGYGSVLIPAPAIYVSKYNFVYNGKTQKPKITIKNADGKTISSSYYTIRYPSGCKNVGSYTLTVTFKGKYSGTVKRTFGIFPKATTITKLSRLSKGFTIKWSKKTAQTTGYMIQYSKNKNFSGAKTVTISKYKTVSTKIRKLTKKKRYYVRIRTYKKIGGTKYVSAWSAVKSIITK